MKIICTICSRTKKEDEGFIPAHTRYLGEHIKKVALIANKEKKPFFILSGKYGLIHQDEKISYYDYYLEGSAIEIFSKKVCDQLKENGIMEIDFYVEEKDSWFPYKTVLQKGADLAGVSVYIKKV